MSRSGSPYGSRLFAPSYVSVPIQILMIFGDGRVQKFGSTTEFYPGGRVCDDPCIGQSFLLPIGTEYDIWVHTVVSLEGSKWAVTIEVSKKLPDEETERVFSVRHGPLTSELNEKWEIVPCDFPQLYELVGDLLPEALRVIRLDECQGELLPEHITYGSGNPHHIDTRLLMRILYRLRVRLSR